MKRPVRGEDGKYHLPAGNFKELFGSRQQVWNGTAYKTRGKMTKKKLLMNKWGRLVSKDKHLSSKKEHKQKKRLFAKYTAKKGQFGAVKVADKKSRKRKVRGGNSIAEAAGGLKSKLGF